MTGRSSADGASGPVAYPRHNRIVEVLMKTILVGVDGSEHGEAALAFAAEEAALRGAHLLIVCAWENPMVV
ncbi:MAG TPA: universal stress protein, partial [Thermoleophilia bacterium]